MALYINTNVSSITAQKNFGRTQQSLNQSMLRLSTGMRINRAADDAAGLAISEGMKAEIRSMGQAKRNANDGISLLQTAEGSLDQQGQNLIRMRELAVQSANGTLSDAQRVSVNDEFEALTEEINRIANVTEFSGHMLLDGTYSDIDFQVGIDGDGNSRVSLTINQSTSDAAGLDIDSLSVSTAAGAQGALATIDTAIDHVTNNRSEIGAQHNQLMSAVSNLETTIENLSAANSRIREVDFATETAELTRTQILMQAGVSILAQANMSPQYALSLLG